MRRLISFSVTHPVSVLMLLAAVLLVGTLCCFSLPVDFLPQMATRELLVATEYEGIASSEMRSMVTIPLEDAFSSLKGLKKISSVSRDGLSLISIELHWGTDADIALMEARQIIDICFETLPSRCGKPTVQKNDAAKRETLVIALVPKDGDLRYARYISDTDIKPRFQRLNGVSTVTVSGGEKEQIDVIVRRDAMESRQLSLQSISDVLAGANFEYPAGTILEGEKELLVKTAGLYTAVSDIEQTPLAYNQGGLLRLSDVAEVRRTSADRETFFIHEGKPAVKIGITKKGDASPLTVSRTVHDETESLRRLYGNWFTFDIIDDISVQVSESIQSLAVSAAVGILVTALIILFFFRSVKYALLVSLVIPMTTLAAFLSLSLTGNTINMMSLSGMAIGLGMVIDAATVVIENIQRAGYASSAGERRESIIEKTNEVALSNFGSSLTTAIVFVPVFFINGLVGELFSAMAVTIITTVLFSCLLSITYIPACVALFTPVHPGRPAVGAQNRFQKVEQRYVSSLSFFTKHSWCTVLCVTGCIAVGVISFLNTKYSMLPEIAPRTISVSLSFESGTKIEKMEETASFIAERLRSEPDISNVSISGGIEPENYLLWSRPDSKKETILVTMNVHGDAEEIENRISGLFDGQRFSVSFEEKKDILSSLLDMSSENYLVLDDTPEKARARSRESASAESTVVPDVSVREFVFIPDRVSGSRFSITALYTASLARNTLEGVDTVPFYENGREIPVRVKLREQDIQTLTELENVGVQLEKTWVPLHTLGRFTEEVNEKVFYRYNRKDAVQIDRPQSAEGLLDLREQEIGELLGSSAFLLVIVIVLLYLVMGAQFESFLIPILLLTALPPSFAGAFFALAVFGQTLNIHTVIALVVLFGTSINNSILLYESCVNRQAASAAEVISACGEKFQAVVVTNLTTICALIPFAIDPGHTSAQSSLSLAIIGGLTVSAVLVLFVVPVIFCKVFSGRNK